MKIAFVVLMLFSLIFFAQNIYFKLSEKDNFDSKTFQKNIEKLNVEVLKRYNDMKMFLKKKWNHYQESLKFF